MRIIGIMLQVGYDYSHRKGFSHVSDSVYPKCFSQLCLPSHSHINF